MNRTGITVLIISCILILAFVCLVLPDSIASHYAAFTQAVALFIGFLLSIKVSSKYKKELKKSFIFLGMFLLLYCCSNINVVWDIIFKVTNNPNVYLYTVISIQTLTYAMLITSCVYTLRVIEVRRIRKWGWIILTFLAFICVWIIAYGIPEARETFIDTPVISVSEMIIRIIDMVIVFMLAPVLLLYIQHMKAKAQDSLTYTLIMTGVIISLISAYLLQITKNISLNQIATIYFHKGSILDAIYIFSYLLIAAGLYCHLKYDEWGYRMIEKALQL